MSLDKFRGLDFQDSFVYRWAIEEMTLEFEIDASLWPESEFYCKPRENEYTCYRRSLIRFTGFHSITGLKEMRDVQSSIDPDGSKDYGNIDILQLEVDGYRISGDFGDVHIQGGNLDLELIE